MVLQPRQRFNNPPPAAGQGASSMPSSSSSSTPWSQYRPDASGWYSNQPESYSSYPSSTGEWSDGSAAMSWPQPNKPRNVMPTGQSGETFATPNQFQPNPVAASGHQQSSVAPDGSQAGHGVVSSQPDYANSSAYGWNNGASTNQWQTQSQWSWPQGASQWPSNQPAHPVV